MSMTGKIRGRVVDSLREPVHGAEIVVTQQEDGPELARAHTDADGRYSIDLPFVPAALLVSAAGKASARAGRCLHEGAPDAELDFRLWDACRLLVRVRDAEGAPVVAAAVRPEHHATRFSWDEGSVAVRERDTDGAGEAAFDVPFGVVAVCVWAPGYALARRELVMEDDAEVEVTLARDERTSVLVRVPDVPAGRAVKVRLYPHADGIGPLPERVAIGMLDGRGEWRATGLPRRGCYEAHLFAEGLRFDEVEVRGSTWTAPDTGDDVASFTFRTVTLERLALPGVVRDAEGRPVVDGHLIDEHGHGAHTDHEGRFVLEGELVRGEITSLRLMSDRLHIVADRTCAPEKPRFEVEEPRLPVITGPMRPTCDVVVDPDRVMELTARPMPRVEGMVVDATGRPVSRCRVDLVAVVSPAAWTVDSTRTDRDGCFAFASADLPGHRLRVQCGNDVEGSRTFVAGAEGASGLRLMRDRNEDTPPRDARAEPGVVDGVVRHADGRPMRGASVVLRRSNARRKVPLAPMLAVLAERAHRKTITSREGSFRFVDVRPGTYTVSVSRAAREATATSAAFEVASEARTQVDLLLG